MPRNKKNKINTNRSFGIVFFIVFMIVAIWPLLNENEVRLWALILSFIFLILGIIKSKILTPFNYAWIKFGIILGTIISPLVMGLVFFLVITPTGLIMRLLGKDVLNKKYSNNLSYWIKRDKNIGSMKKQF
jgi:hypothetical protein